MKDLLDSTRERILSAAESLFAADGVAGTSMRAITALARVNLAAVNYHFGTKDGLVEAVYRRRLEPLNKLRRANLDELEARYGDRPIPLEDTVDAFLRPVLALATDPVQGGPALLRLIGQSHADASRYFEQFFAGEYRAVVERYQRALARALPELDDAEVWWRLNFAIGALSYPVAERHLLEVVSGQSATREDLDRILEYLRPFLIAGLRAAPAAPLNSAAPPAPTTAPGTG